MLRVQLWNPFPAQLPTLWRNLQTWIATRDFATNAGRTAPPAVDRWALAVTLIQTSHNNPTHATDITNGKAERKWLRTCSSKTTHPNITHRHTQTQQVTVLKLRVSGGDLNAPPHSRSPQGNKLLLFSSTLHAVYPKSLSVSVPLTSPPPPHTHASTSYMSEK